MLINKLQAINIQPVFVVDGEIQEEKLDSFLKRAKSNKSHPTSPHKNTPYSPDTVFNDGGFVDLATLVSIVFQVCNQKKIEYYRSIGDGDALVTLIAKQLNAPVVSNDSDYYVLCDDVFYINTFEFFAFLIQPDQKSEETKLRALLETAERCGQTDFIQSYKNREFSIKINFEELASKKPKKYSKNECPKSEYSKSEYSKSEYSKSEHSKSKNSKSKYSKSKHSKCKTENPSSNLPKYIIAFDQTLLCEKLSINPKMLKYLPSLMGNDWTPGLKFFRTSEIKKSFEAVQNIPENMLKTITSQIPNHEMSLNFYSLKPPFITGTSPSIPLNSKSFQNMISKVKTFIKIDETVWKMYFQGDIFGLLRLPVRGFIVRDVEPLLKARPGSGSTACEIALSLLFAEVIDNKKYRVYHIPDGEADFEESFEVVDNSVHPKNLSILEAYEKRFDKNFQKNTVMQIFEHPEDFEQKNQVSEAKNKPKNGKSSHKKLKKQDEKPTKSPRKSTFSTDFPEFHLLSLTLAKFSSTSSSNFADIMSIVDATAVMVSLLSYHFSTFKEKSRLLERINRKSFHVQAHTRTSLFF